MPAAKPNAAAPTARELARLAVRTRGTAAMRALARKAGRELASVGPRAVIDVAKELVRGGEGERFLAYLLIEARTECVLAMSASDVEVLGDGIDSWVSVDCFACYVAGPAWREGIVDDARVLRWTRSKDRWKRRAALASTTALNMASRGGSGDARRTLLVCAELVDDRDDMVVKALSWALRALVHRDRAAVERFVARHGDRLAARVRREVANELSTGRRTRAADDHGPFSGPAVGGTTSAAGVAAGIVA